jgi:hypothetical protein
MRTNSGGDEDSFFLYSVGEQPEALTLGSLVLEKYWQPLIARHYTHEHMKYILFFPFAPPFTFHLLCA